MKNSKILFIRYFILPLLVLFLFTASCSDDDNDDPQTTPTTKLLDTSGLDLYIKNAEKLQAGTEPSEAEWNAYFDTPFLKGFMETRGFNDEQKQELKQGLKITMRTAYQNLPPGNLTPGLQGMYEHNLRYKTKLNELKEYSTQLNNGNMRQVIANIIAPFLPARLQNEDLIPPALYAFHILGAEATGTPDALEMDAMLSYTIDSYPLTRGYAAAHEAYHSVTLAALEKRRIPIPAGDPRNEVLSTLKLISQEGIADLIDKDLTLRPDSPVYSYWLFMIENEQQNAISFINNLNTIAEGLSRGEVINLPTNLYGGHQPGRYMGRMIRETGGFRDLIVDPENPFAFLYIYNTAARRLGSSDYPVFSDTAINFLRQLESQLIRPL
ncbi:MAG TPA: DUF5700 domain-containing putative Zn-dependent protease [Flavobacterium sp.]